MRRVFKAVYVLLSISACLLFLKYMLKMVEDKEKLPSAEIILSGGGGVECGEYITHVANGEVYYIPAVI